MTIRAMSEEEMVSICIRLLKEGVKFEAVKGSVFSDWVITLTGAF